MFLPKNNAEIGRQKDIYKSCAGYTDEGSLSLFLCLTHVNLLCKFDASCVIKTEMRLAVQIWSRHPEYKAVALCCRYLGRESGALL